MYSSFLITFVLGTAAGVVLQRFMRTEQGERILEDLKATAHDLRSEAEELVDRAPQYLEQIKAKVEEVLKTTVPDAEKVLRDLVANLSGKKPGGSTAS
ncbi:YtxH domain-containing protein [Telluribacter sp. SYSU D00476]|uniref:YtxH domain-containing protein n=1 Tax=Telluribacter sp. SYSU D00476 TaxID=2811430 RepID=UPI001FF6AEB4|nr:YtxH domain-containing protein [Telluribacter sp. SYSU D00476]